MTADENKIETLYHQWKTAVEASSIDGYAQILHQQVKLRPPGGIRITGRDKYTEFLQPVFASATYEIKVITPLEITVMGNTAIAEYQYSVHRHEFDKAASDKLAEGALTAPVTDSAYIDILQKDDNGNWLVIMHTWSNMDG